MDIASPEYHATRRRRITAMIDPSGRGLEIGASHNPAAPKSAGYNVEIVDHLDQAGLIAKYAGHASVVLENIEPVDHVWTGGSLSELVGQPGAYDWIIAAHVVEHMPDLIHFRKECQALLRPGGVLSLVVPDKRYCFDHLRRRTSTGDLLQAHLERRERHTPGQIYDHFSNASKLHESGSWHPGASGWVAFMQPDGVAQGMYEQSQGSADYMDIHGWVFTPSAFRMTMQELNALGLIQFNEIEFVPTRDCEFFLSYAHAPMRDPVDRLELAKQALHEERIAYFP